MCVRLRMGWTELKRAALDPKRNHVQTAVAHTGVEKATWLSEEVCIFALRVVAARREIDQLSPSEYDETADELRAERAQRWAHGATIITPTSEQIILEFGTWAKALRAAGLSDRRRVYPLRGVPYVEALELALETRGALATYRELEAFIRQGCRLQLERPHREHISHDWALGELRRRRAAAGKWTPDGYPPKAQRPDWGALVHGLAGPPREEKLTDERCVQFLMRFLREGGRQSRKAYVAWASRTPGAPAASSMGRSGRPQFSVLRAQARVRLRAGEQPAV